MLQTPLYKGIEACYMLSEHLTYRKAPVYRYLSHIMLYGYMFFEIS